MSKNYRDLTKAFVQCAIDAGAFRHIDHVGVAYELLRSQGFLEASLTYSACLKKIAEKAGAKKKFNTTITLALISLIAERMEAAEHDSFDAFIAANQDLLSPNVLAKWYTPGRLRSDLARTVFLMPDAAA